MGIPLPNGARKRPPSAPWELGPDADLPLGRALRSTRTKQTTTRGHGVGGSISVAATFMLQPRLTTGGLSTIVDSVRASAPSPSDQLAAAVGLRRLANRLEDEGVERALTAGWGWSRIAEALGVTRQAAHKKHAKRVQGGQ